MKKEEVVEILKQHGLILDREKSIPYGVQLVFRNGAMVSVYHTGNFNVQGKYVEVVRDFLGQSAPIRPTIANSNIADDIF